MYQPPVLFRLIKLRAVETPYILVQIIFYTYNVSHQLNTNCFYILLSQVILKLYIKTIFFYNFSCFLPFSIFSFYRKILTSKLVAIILYVQFMFNFRSIHCYVRMAKNCSSIERERESTSLYFFLRLLRLKINIINISIDNQIVR